MYIIRKDFEFSASHTLTGLSENHPCSRLHGHNYVVTLELRSPTLNKIGFVQDYRDLSVVKDWIDTHFDHRHLNDQMDTNPTAENIAFYLYRIFKEAYSLLYAVEVRETHKTMARYEPS